MVDARLDCPHPLPHFLGFLNAIRFLRDSVVLVDVSPWLGTPLMQCLKWVTNSFASVCLEPIKTGERVAG